MNGSGGSTKAAVFTDAVLAPATHVAVAPRDTQAAAPAPAAKGKGKGKGKKKAE